ncbi:MAG: proline--tRNA ligase [Fibrobacteria bacterium]|nr:proline--tRNA ligase [Fibrobacteria bacterium]
MKVSQLVVQTLREAPASAELPSHIFLLRGGYIKQLASGLYSVLPLGKRVLQKIENIIREEMNRISGQEIDLPLVHPKELWEESGRYDAIGDELLRFKDRTNHDMVLAMTHEEAVTDLIRHVVSSYKQLPCMVYQFKLKFRDEPRARGGLIRVREFVMKDAYSFHTTHEDLDKYYQLAYEAYKNIFQRVGIAPVIVQSDTGIMGGKIAHEFMLEAPSGEDNLIIAEDGGYRANQEIAVFDKESVKEDEKALEKVPTPGKKSIKDVSELLKVETSQLMKCVFYQMNDSLVTVLMRGDLNVSEIKIKNYLKVPAIFPAEDKLILKFGFVPGYASAVGIPSNKNLRILVDDSVVNGSNFVAGANEKGFHIKNVNFNRDFNSSDIGDFALAESGHKCKGSEVLLKAVKGIEIGNIFKLGTKFSTSMKAEFLDEKGKSNPMVMGCYGIGVGRLMAAVVENSHDKFGPIWPKSIAPYQVHLLNIGADPDVVSTCDHLYADLQKEGYDVLYDDRDERPGVKFKDADLWGSPVRIGVSKKTIAEKACEWKLRNETSFEKISLDRVLLKLKDYFGI